MMYKMDPHIARDLEVVLPYCHEVVRLLKEDPSVSPVDLYEALDEWRMEAGMRQRDAMLIDALKDEPVRYIDGVPVKQFGSKFTERLRGQDTSQFLTGPGTRTLVELTKRYEEAGLTATQVRKALNQAAHNLGTTVKDVLPELVPFISGMSTEPRGRAN